jgi:hypothetical protein
MSKQSRNFMAEKIATIHHHSASQREELEGFFPLAYELIQRALRAIEDVEDDRVPEDVAKAFRDSFKSEAQTFLDAAKPLCKDTSAADARRRQAERR